MFTNRNHILALDRYSKGIREDIEGIDCFYVAFGGLCVTAEYIASRSLDALREEKKELDKHGISVVVSFLEEINHFPGLTLCDAVPEYYKKSMDYYKTVMNKMSDLGIKTALLTTHASVESNAYPEQRVYEKMKETFSLLSEYSEEKGIRLLLTNTRFRIVDTVERQMKMLQEIGDCNIGIALNFNHLSESEAELSIKKVGEKLGAIILGGPVSGKHSEYLPISEESKSVRLAGALDDVLLIDWVYPVNTARVYEDCMYMGWIKKD